ncbi:MAG: peptidoglycan editing factor PgeF [Ideonella sp.]
MNGETSGFKAPLDWLRPGWAHRGVDAVMTTRHGGVSKPPFDSFNLRAGIGDDLAAVARNEQLLRASMAARPVWLEQVHGARVVRLQASDADPAAIVHRADASVSNTPGLACMVQVADCLPVLFSAAGRAVAAAHAGWRGLAAGVLEATLANVCDAADCGVNEVEAWLGACIGPGQFEVGPDVLDAFDVRGATGSSRFVERGPAHPGKWLADLAGLAEDRLRAAGASRIQAVKLCTVDHPSRFFSYRRDGVTGRMAAGIWLVER